MITVSSPTSLAEVTAEMAASATTASFSGLSPKAITEFSVSNGGTPTRAGFNPEWVMHKCMITPNAKVITAASDAMSYARLSALWEDTRYDFLRKRVPAMYEAAKKTSKTSSPKILPAMLSRFPCALLLTDGKKKVVDSIMPFPILLPFVHPRTHGMSKLKDGVVMSVAIPWIRVKNSYPFLSGIHDWARLMWRGNPGGSYDKAFDKNFPCEYDIPFMLVSNHIVARGTKAEEIGKILNEALVASLGFVGCTKEAPHFTRFGEICSSSASAGVERLNTLAASDDVLDVAFWDEMRKSLESPEVLFSPNLVKVSPAEVPRIITTLVSYMSDSLSGVNLSRSTDANRWVSKQGELVTAFEAKVAEQLKIKGPVGPSVFEVGVIQNILGDPFKLQTKSLI